jgi:hypothetical protein
MKLRIRGDSLRVRVSPGELETLVAGGTVVDVVHFGPSADECLRYEVVADATLAELDATFDARTIRVRVPAAPLRRIAASDEVGLSATKPVGAATLAILFEKDFRCLVPRAGEDDDGFTRPADAPSC